MMRIGVVALDSDPNPQYRALLPMDELSRRGHSVGVAVLEGTFDRLPPLDAFLQFDIVYFWRLHEAPVRRLARRLAEAGIATIWDNDDNLTAVPRGAPSYRFHSGVAGQRAWSEMKSMIKLVDAVTTPSPELAVQYREVGQPNVHVIENYVPSARPGRRGRRGRVADEVVVGWVAGGEHVVDATALGLSETMSRLLERREGVRVVTIGVPMFGLRHSRYSRLDPMPLSELPDVIAQFDIGIAPLIDIPFNRARSNLKVKEYASQGVPWLASPIGPYVGLGADHGGRLVEDDRWLDDLFTLVDDRKARKRLADAAHRWGRTQTIRENVGEWEQILEAAVARVRARNAGAEHR